MVRSSLVLGVLAAGVLALVNTETSSASPHHHRARVAAERMPLVFDYANLPANARGTVSFTQGVRSIVARRALSSTPGTIRFFARRRGFTITAANNAPIDADVTVAPEPAAGATDLIGHATVPKGARLTVEVGDGAPEQIGGAFSIPLAVLGDSAPTTTPPPLVDDVDTMAQDTSGRWGIQIGTTFYPNPSPGGDAVQALFLDRDTLQPVGDKNWYMDGTDSPVVGTGALHAHVVHLSTNDVVILAQPPTGHVPVQPGNQTVLDDWNHTLDVLGASDFSRDQVTQAGDSFSVIGVPNAEQGTAWQTVTSRGGGAAALKGSFIHSGGFYAFTPQQIAFDTSAGSTSGSNTMSIAIPGSPFTAALPPNNPPIVEGFHVVALDGTTLAVKFSRAYAVDEQSYHPSLGLVALDEALTQAKNGKDLVFVQSIGHVTAPGPESSSPDVSDSARQHPRCDRRARRRGRRVGDRRPCAKAGGLTVQDTPAPPPTSSDMWNAVAKDLVALGGTLPLVNSIDGSYTLIGGAGLGPDQVVETSSATAPPGSEQPTAARFNGYLTIDHDGRYSAQLADRTGAANLNLYKVIHQPPTPWPLTQTGTPADQKAYQAAMAYITNKLGFTDPEYGDDLRIAYYAADTFNYATKKDALDELSYPDSQAYTETQFDTLKHELKDEFDMLGQVQNLFDGWKKPWESAVATELVDVKKLGDDIVAAVNPPKDESVALNVTEALVSGALEAIAPYAGEHLIEAGVGVITSGLALGASLATDHGSPLPDRIQATVDNLSQATVNSVTATTDALDALRRVVVSDYGKLVAMANADSDPNWASGSETIHQIRNSLEAGAERMYYSHLLPLAYDRRYLYDGIDPAAPPPLDPAKCEKTTNVRNAPPNSWRTVTVRFDETSSGSIVPVENTWLLTHGDYQSPPAPAPAKLMDPLVTPVGQRTREPNPDDDQDGVGVVLEQFLAKYFPRTLPVGCL